MGRPALTSEQRGATRGRIRDAAIALYREEGLEGITMRAVAARSGVAPSALYEYYAGRTALLRALWQEPAAAAAKAVSKVASDVGDPVERIRQMIRVYLQLAEENPEVYRGAFLYVRPGSRPKPPVRPLRDVDFHRQLVRALQEGHEQGLLRSGDTEIDAQCLWAILHGALALPVNMEGYDFAASRRLAERSLALVLGGLNPNELF